MTVKAADVAELRQRLAEDGPAEHGLAALQSTIEIIAWLCAAARSDGADEVDQVELFIRADDMPPADVRKHEKLLRRLGYVQVADMMRRIARRRTKTLAPLS